jgi:hypothetical protein
LEIFYFIKIQTVYGKIDFTVGRVFSAFRLNNEEKRILLELDKLLRTEDDKNKG